MTRIRVKLSNGLIAQLTESNLTAEIIESAKARGSVLVPRHIDYQSKKYLITRIGDNAFSENHIIDSLTFSADSAVRSIGNKAFSHSSLKSLFIPESLEELDDWWCFCAKNLVQIEVSPKNPNFSFINENFLIWKNKDVDANSRYDVLIFARRNITGEVEIPFNIRRIAPYAFDKCERFRSLLFCTTPESMLKVMDYSAFCGCGNLEKIGPIPTSVITVGNCCFSFARKLSRVDFMSEKVSIGDYCFENCYSLSSASFPNARKVKIGEGAFNEVEADFALKVPLYAEIGGEGLTDIRSKIRRISEPFVDETEMMNQLQESPKSSTSSQKTSPSPRNSSRSPVTSSASSSGKHKNHSRCNQRTNNVKILIERIAVLEKRLSKYEDVVPFDVNSYIKGDSPIKDIYNRTKNGEKERSPKNLKESGLIDYEAFSEDKESNKASEKNVPNDSSSFLINDEEERFHKSLSKLGEGTTSVAFKIIDTRNNKIMCKKFIKVEDGRISKKGVQRAVNEFRQIQKIEHPCICSAIGINAREQFNFSLIESNKESGQNSAKNSPEKETNVKNAVTTTLFFEFLELNLKQCIKDNMLTNTLKSRIALEVACGMSHIHKVGMIHRDLRIENIMLNSVLEAKIIGLGLDRIAMLIKKGASRDEDSHFKNSLMKDISTFAYMSPELQKDQNYDAKTDVYSFGVVLHVLFTGKLPKLSLKDKVGGKKAELPDPSESISTFCLGLIEKCLSFDPSKRPSFDEILYDMQKNSYSLANEVDADSIARRHRALNRFESLNIGTPFISSP